jgi:acyl dehydratase
VLEFRTRPEQALLYRLSGDYNPLHADPAAARAAGFERPILHGLCSYGICCRAVLKAYADYDPARIRAHDARFTAPVWPGETLAVELWRDGDTVSFQARASERDVLVVRHGRSLLG